jgi:uncharacterized protein (TIGR00375 family)
MKFIADLHIHSRFSRATAKNLDLENLYVEACKKGLAVVATGDFTHPAWFAELEAKLVPAESGLFRLNPDLAAACDKRVPASCRGKVRFMLETEISNIYKKGDRTRKNHNLVFMPDMARAREFNQRLEQLGNIHSDGRPILGLDARDLLEIVLETDPGAHLIPAHVWTPWFSLLGSKSGFDSVAACFDDLCEHIFALETGLSSDPPMNWRVSALDGYTLVSNSDAHSPAKLGREANCFDTELSYAAIFAALKNGQEGGFEGTIEFYPEEGKYHVDGHRKCGVQLLPRETRVYDGLCPVCGKPLVLGVLHRVEELADRPQGHRPPSGYDYVHLVPLEDILAELLKVGPKSKRVARAQAGLIAELGPELEILRDVPLEDLKTSTIAHLDEAIRRVRAREVTFSPGYDGEYGRLQIFSPDEWQELSGQRALFYMPDDVGATDVGIKYAGAPSKLAPPKGADHHSRLTEVLAALDAATYNAIADMAGKTPPASATATQAITLNPEQQLVVEHGSGPLIVVAGPGTGKTRVLTERIVRLVNDGLAAGDNILAVTFTQKAAAEMQERLGGRLAQTQGAPLVTTFHGLCLQLLLESGVAPDKEADDPEGPAPEAGPAAGAGFIVSGQRQRALMADALEMSSALRPASSTAPITVKKALAAISAVKQVLLPPDAPSADLVAAAGGLDIAAIYSVYQRMLEDHGGWDYDDLIFQVVTRLENDGPYLAACRKRFTHIFVDEYQDLNASQYRIVRALSPPESELCVIGDPDQAIYGFRGARRAYFNNFLEDYPMARVVHLRRNYRSVQSVLNAAFEVIANQHVSLTGSGDDRPVAQMAGNPQIFELTAATERSEAVAIGKIIDQMIGGTGFHHLDFGAVQDQATARQRSFGDFAVLYRTHRQGEVMAEQLGKGGIPCQIASKQYLLGHPGAAALIAVVQLMNNSALFADFATAADTFKAGIGPKTLLQFKRWAYQKGFGLKEALVAARRVPLPGISLARQQAIFDFIRRLDQLRSRLDPQPLVDQLRHLLSETPLGTLFDTDETAAPVMSLLLRQAGECGAVRGRFLESLSLLTDTDSYDPRAERVALMTLHAAKGLEFPVVFIAGCEEGFLPHEPMSVEDVALAAAEMDEERRLLYVGMTRARHLLFLSRARKRRLYGKNQAREPSPFLTAIDEDLLIPWDQRRPKKAAPKQQQLGLFD